MIEYVDDMDFKYILIQGWMIDKLNLKGNELLVYAIINSFTQNDGMFLGSMNYLAKRINTTKESIRLVLNSLISKDLIEKKDIHLNKIKYCIYNTKKVGEVYKKFGRGIQKSCTNNKSNNIKERINNNKLLLIPKKSFEKPSLDDIKEYCLERKSKVNPEQFFDYYESIGWKVGQNEIKNWKACLRTWEKNNSYNSSYREDIGVDLVQYWEERRKNQKELTKQEEEELDSILAEFKELD